MNSQSEYFLGLLGQIKLFHWSVKHYAAHVALDKLHSSLSEHVDKFMEVYIGKFELQPIEKFMITMNATSDCSNLCIYLQKQNENIKKIRSSLNKATELQNILDEMMGDINQCLYLLNLI
jgi:DNA-binding ferritin-like protein